MVTPASGSTTAPSDAIVLFDGTRADEWQSAGGGSAQWTVQDGNLVVKPGSGSIISRLAFGDMQLHVEWTSPTPASGSSQGRGNSGVFLMGLYEIQVLDSHDNFTYADGGAGGVYGQYPPLVNASRVPGEWQTYDIVFHAPRFVNGALVAPARVTLLWNGILAQDNVSITGPTNWHDRPPYVVFPDQLPIALQDHGQPVRYRNIWVRPLPPAAESLTPTFAPTLAVRAEEVAELVGDYAGGGMSFTIAKSSDGLLLNKTPLRMIAEDSFYAIEPAGMANRILVVRGEGKKVVAIAFSSGGNYIECRKK